MLKIYSSIITKLFLSLVIFSFSTLSLQAKPDHLIKFATLAPEGSTWSNVMNELDKEVREATGDKVGFKIYAGGIQGDEPDVIRKMRFGQLHSAGFTGMGLGEILPEIRVLEIPFMFKNAQEIDYVTEALYDHFDAEFRKKGYVLLGWTEVGFVYLFSNNPIRKKDDMMGAKVWSWQGDPLANELFEVMGVSPRPLSVTEVLTALQTGMLDAVYCGPYAAVGLQWFTRVKYMLDLPLTNATGAALMTKKQFDKIPPEYQEILLKISRQKLKELTTMTRKDNSEAIKQMINSGIILNDPPDQEEMKRFQEVGKQVQHNLIGQLYSEELMNEVVNSLNKYRNGAEE